MTRTPVICQSFGRDLTLAWHRRRFLCSNCGQRHLEQHDEFDRGSTRRLATQLEEDARNMWIWR